MEQVLLDQLNVEALIVLEGIKPLMSNAALIHH